MSTITTRVGKGAALTHIELDANFTNLNTDKLETETDPVVGAVTGIVKADGAGNISAAVSGTDYIATESFTELSQDTTPQLGGNLDGQGNKLEDVELDNYKETIYSLGTTSGTIAPDVVNGNVQTVTLNGNATINGFTNAEAGQSITLIITQDATGSRTLASTMLFAGGDATLSTDPNSIDVLGIFYDGTTYYASLTTGFATPA